jgi:predicted transcriptional regulator
MAELVHIALKVRPEEAACWRKIAEQERRPLVTVIRRAIADYIAANHPPVAKKKAS